MKVSELGEHMANGRTMPDKLFTFFPQVNMDIMKPEGLLGLVS